VDGKVRTSCGLLAEPHVLTRADAAAKLLDLWHPHADHGAHKAWDGRKWQPLAPNWEALA
jgi:hypothetical protein